ncbi:MAG: efflux RND transporter periplasmic adaptor subunit [Pseudomonadota bacterium]
MKKWRIVLLILLISAGIAWGVFFSGKGDNPEPDAGDGKEIIMAQKGDILVVVEATGRVIPNQEVEIKCKASGEITSLPIDVSDTVQKGDLLLQLNPEDEERSVRRAEVALAVSQARRKQANLNLNIAERNLVTEEARTRAALVSAEAKLQEARFKRERVEQLLDKKMASPEERDVARTVYAQAEAEHETAKARMEDLKTAAIQIETKREEVKIAEADVETDKINLSDAAQRLEDTTLVAPIDGIVAVNNVQVGQIIASGINNVGGGTTVMTLVDLSRIFILVSVDESDIGQVRIGQIVDITVDAHPGIQFPGSVDRVATKGAVTSNVVTFEVKVEVKGQDRNLLKPEMTANVEIMAVEKNGVLLVPLKAIERKRNEQFVTVRKADGTDERKLVTTGVTDGVSVEILSGLQRGSQIAIPSKGAQSRWQVDGDKNGDNARKNPRKMGLMGRGPGR